MIFKKIIFLRFESFFSIGQWLQPGMKVWSKSLALCLCVTFIFPYLTWAFSPPALSAAETLQFNQKSVTIPEKLGSIIQTHRGGERLVICIQDLHCNYEVQKNIAGMINFAAEHYGVNLVAVEGASLPINVKRLAAYPADWARQDIGEYLLKEGKITGPEFMAATGKRLIRLEGIENPALYQSSLKLVQSFLTEENAGYVQDLRDGLNGLKPAVYTSELLSLDQGKQAYREGKLTLLKYALMLSTRAQGQGVDCGAYPNFQKYTSLRQETSDNTADSEELFKEIDAVEQTLRRGLYQNELQARLDEMEFRLDGMERLLNISASAEDLAVFLKHPAAFNVQAFSEFIQQTQPGGEWVPDAEAGQLDAVLEQVKTFYQLADQRSVMFVENLRRSMEKHQTKISVLITGGFHTEQILARLKVQGLSYVSVKPRITRQDVANPYFDLLRDRHTPLEKLLEKNQTILAVASRFPQVAENTQVDLQKQPENVRLLDRTIGVLENLADIIDRAEQKFAGNPQMPALARSVKAWEKTGTLIVELKEGLAAVLRKPGAAWTAYEETAQVVPLSLKSWHVALLDRTTLTKLEPKLEADGPGLGTAFSQDMFEKLSLLGILSLPVILFFFTPFSTWLVFIVGAGYLATLVLLPVAVAHAVRRALTYTGINCGPSRLLFRNAEDIRAIQSYLDNAQGKISYYLFDENSGRSGRLFVDRLALQHLNWFYRAVIWLHEMMHAKLGLRLEFVAVPMTLCLPWGIISTLLIALSLWLNPDSVFFFAGLLVYNVAVVPAFSNWLARRIGVRQNFGGHEGLSTSRWTPMSNLEIDAYLSAYAHETSKRAAVITSAAQVEKRAEQMTFWRHWLRGDAHSPNAALVKCPNRVEDILLIKSDYRPGDLETLRQAVRATEKKTLVVVLADNGSDPAVMEKAVRSNSTETDRQALQQAQAQRQERSRRVLDDLRQVLRADRRGIRVLDTQIRSTAYSLTRLKDLSRIYKRRLQGLKFDHVTPMVVASEPHGHVVRLKKVISWMRQNGYKRMVFLGDYLGKYGEALKPVSRPEQQVTGFEVIDELRQLMLEDDIQISALMGKSEHMFIRAMLGDPESSAIWLNQLFEGKTVLRDLQRLSVEKITEKTPALRARDIQNARVFDQMLRRIVNPENRTLSNEEWDAAWSQWFRFHPKLLEIAEFMADHMRFVYFEDDWRNLYMVGGINPELDWRGLKGVAALRGMEREFKETVKSGLRLTRLIQEIWMIMEQPVAGAGEQEIAERIEQALTLIQEERKINRRMDREVVPAAILDTAENILVDRLNSGVRATPEQLHELFTRFFSSLREISSPLPDVFKQVFEDADQAASPFNLDQPGGLKEAELQARQARRNELGINTIINPANFTEGVQELGQIHVTDRHGVRRYAVDSLAGPQPKYEPLLAARIKDETAVTEERKRYLQAHRGAALGANEKVTSLERVFEFKKASVDAVLADYEKLLPARKDNWATRTLGTARYMIRAFQTAQIQPAGWGRSWLITLVYWGVWGGILGLVAWAGLNHGSAPEGWMLGMVLGLTPDTNQVLAPRIYANLGLPVQWKARLQENVQAVRDAGQVKIDVYNRFVKTSLASIGPNYHINKLMNLESAADKTFQEIEPALRHRPGAMEYITFFLKIQIVIHQTLNRAVRRPHLDLVTRFQTALKSDARYPRLLEAYQRSYGSFADARGHVDESALIRNLIGVILARRALGEYDLRLSLKDGTSISLREFWPQADYVIVDSTGFLEAQVKQAARESFGREETIKVYQESQKQQSTHAESVGDILQKSPANYLALKKIIRTLYPDTARRLAQEYGSGDLMEDFLEEDLLRIQDGLEKQRPVHEGAWKQYFVSIRKDLAVVADFFLFQKVVQYLDTTENLNLQTPSVFQDYFSSLQTFGDRVDALIDTAGLSNAEVGAAVGRKADAVTGWRSNRKLPEPPVLAKLAEFLANSLGRPVSPAWLLLGREMPAALKTWSTFANRLDVLLMLSGLTQSELAQEVGVNAATVKNRKNRNTQIKDIDMYARMAVVFSRALGIKIDPSMLMYGCSTAELLRSTEVPDPWSGKAVPVTVGVRIQALRLAKGWTLEDLAQQLQMSFIGVQKWELLGTQPLLPTLKKFSVLFKINIPELAYGKSLTALLSESRTMGEKLRWVRVALGMEAEDMSAALKTLGVQGAAPNTVLNWERDDMQPKNEDTYLAYVELLLQNGYSKLDGCLFIEGKTLPGLLEDGFRHPEKGTGEVLRYFRLASGLSREVLAERLGVSLDTLRRWERGEPVPSSQRQHMLEILRQGRSNGLITQLEIALGIDAEKIPEAVRAPETENATDLGAHPETSPAPGTFAQANLQVRRELQQILKNPQAADWAYAELLNRYGGGRYQGKLHDSFEAWTTEELSDILINRSMLTNRYAANPQKYSPSFYAFYRQEIVDLGMLVAKLGPKVFRLSALYGTPQELKNMMDNFYPRPVQDMPSVLAFYREALAGDISDGQQRVLNAWEGFPPSAYPLTEAQYLEQFERVLGQTRALPLQENLMLRARLLAIAVASGVVTLGSNRFGKDARPSPLSVEDQALKEQFLQILRDTKKEIEAFHMVSGFEPASHLIEKLRNAGFSGAAVLVLGNNLHQVVWVNGWVLDPNPAKLLQKQDSSIQGFNFSPLVEDGVAAGKLSDPAYYPYTQGLHVTPEEEIERLNEKLKKVLGGGLMPWAMAFWVRLGGKAETYRRWVSGVFENLISAKIGAPVLGTLLAAAAAGAGMSLTVTAGQAGWLAFFVFHFVQMLAGLVYRLAGQKAPVGLRAPPARDILAAGLITVIGLGLGLAPLSIGGILLHLAVNRVYARLRPTTAEPELTDEQGVPKKPEAVFAQPETPRPRMNEPLLFKLDPMLRRFPNLWRGWMALQALRVAAAAPALDQTTLIQSALQTDQDIKRLTVLGYPELDAELKILLKHPEQAGVQALSLKTSGLWNYLKGLWVGHAVVDAMGKITFYLPTYVLASVRAQDRRSVRGLENYRWSSRLFQHMVHYQGLRMTQAQIQANGYGGLAFNPISLEALRAGNAVLIKNSKWWNRPRVIGWSGDRVIYAPRGLSRPALLHTIDLWQKDREFRKTEDMENLLPRRRYGLMNSV
jgi:transcriptional regulator with XRE-family HTH domain